MAAFADEMALAANPRWRGQGPRPGGNQLDQQLPLEMMPNRQRLQQLLDYRPDEWGGQDILKPPVQTLPPGGHRLYNPSRDDRRVQAPGLGDQMKLASLRSPYPDLPETLDGPITDPKAEAESWIRGNYQFQQVPGRTEGEMQDQRAQQFFNSNILGQTSPYEKGLWR